MKGWVRSIGCRGRPLLVGMIEWGSRRVGSFREIGELLTSVCSTMYTFSCWTNEIQSLTVVCVVYVAEAHTCVTWLRRLMLYRDIEFPSLLGSTVARCVRTTYGSFALHLCREASIVG